MSGNRGLSDGIEGLPHKGIRMQDMVSLRKYTCGILYPAFFMRQTEILGWFFEAGGVYGTVCMVSVQ